MLIEKREILKLTKEKLTPKQRLYFYQYIDYLHQCGFTDLIYYYDTKEILLEVGI